MLFNRAHRCKYHGACSASPQSPAARIYWLCFWKYDRSRRFLCQAIAIVRRSAPLKALRRRLVCRLECSCGIFRGLHLVIASCLARKDPILFLSGCMFHCLLWTACLMSSRRSFWAEGAGAMVHLSLRLLAKPSLALLGFIEGLSWTGFLQFFWFLSMQG